MDQDPRSEPQDSPKDAAAKPAQGRGCSDSTADLAVEGRPRLQDRFAEAPYARPAEPLPDGAPLDQLAEKKAVVGDAQEALLDEAIEESFPASDPPSVQPRIT